MQTAWLKTSQLIVVVSSAFSLGLYLLRFMSGRWDGGDLAALIGFSTSLVVFSALLLAGFWKTK
jgi:hypothetical protein